MQAGSLFRGTTALYGDLPPYLDEGQRQIPAEGAVQLHPDCVIPSQHTSVLR